MPVKVLRDKDALIFLTVGCLTVLVVNQSPGCKLETSHELAVEVKDPIAKAQRWEKGSSE